MADAEAAERTAESMAAERKAAERKVYTSRLAAIGVYRNKNKIESHQ